MDRITKSLLDEFVQGENLSSLPEDQQFEHFASFLTVNRSLSEPVDTSDVVTGAGGDTGIDGIAIIVNGMLFSDPHLISEYLEESPSLDVTFIFIQAERSANFNSAKIGTFAFGVEDFFKENHTQPRNDTIKRAAHVMDLIYNKSSKFKKNPVCRLYYVTTGAWNNDLSLVARKEAAVNNLKATNLFSAVDFFPIDADAIQKLFQESKNSVSREFEFIQKTVAPSIQGVDEAYLGILPAKEFLKLIKDDNNEILKGVFYDNIRDWQEWNPVNSEIQSTLASNLERTRFALMNNGITIIAKTLRATGNRFFIEDYQIVNGCQTSHVLFNQRDQLLSDDSVMVPLRLISTKDEGVIASIIKATNRQTSVTEENLLALTDFQKKIEAFFPAFDSDKKRLYYERRSRQYNNTGVEKTRIIPPNILIRAFASMFLEEPHRTTRNFRGLFESFCKDYFQASDRLEPYYVAAFAYYKLEYLFRNGAIDNKYKRPGRYQVLLAFKLLATTGTHPKMNSKDMKEYCESLMAILWNDQQSENLFKKATQAIQVLSNDNFDSDNLRTAQFTQNLKAHCIALVNKASK